MSEKELVSEYMKNSQNSVKKIQLEMGKRHEQIVDQRCDIWVKNKHMKRFSTPLPLGNAK